MWSIEESIVDLIIENFTLKNFLDLQHHYRTIIIWIFFFDKKIHFIQANDNNHWSRWIDCKYEIGLIRWSCCMCVIRNQKIIFIFIKTFTDRDLFAIWEKSFSLSLSLISCYCVDGDDDRLDLNWGYHHHHHNAIDWYETFSKF